MLKTPVTWCLPGVVERTAAWALTFSILPRYAGLRLLNAVNAW
ncbi:hypothetical protein [Actinacidiphila alni]|nr:hypothetical protein [Actinacidiphila alni]